MASFIKKIVVKVGSSIIAPEGVLDNRLILRLVEDLLKVQEYGYKVILVTSGAIAKGVKQVGFKEKPKDIHSLMALSSIGQINLMEEYAEKFRRYNHLCAQLLLTWEDFDNRTRFLNIRHTINKLLEIGAIPIINENDAISCQEIRFGDNDRLSALVSDLVSAQLLIILSDVDGLMKDKVVLPVVDKIDTTILQLVRKKKGQLTSGGMMTKLEAAKIATSSGVKMVITNGRLDNVLARIAKGEALGTVFLPSGKIDQARKRWIAFSKKVKGKLYIDQGAKEAILNRGKSLLSVGIVKAEGEFKRLDAVEVLDQESRVIGCGLSNYSAHELRDKNKRLDKEVIHRDNFVRSQE